MRIGDFARLGNVSARALRFYGAIGLLHPMHIDPRSGFRHYCVSQIARLQQISAFQDLGFSLARIRDLLRRDMSAASLRELMEQRHRELRGRIQDDVARLARIELQLQTLARNNSATSPVLVRHTKDTWVVSLRKKLQRYEEADDLFHEIEEKVPARCLAGERVALWHACERSGHEIDCEVVRYLKRPVKGPRGLRSYRLPAATIASVFHLGSDAGVSGSYALLNRWLEQTKLNLDGAKRETYWTEEGSEPLTEIQYPLKHAVMKRSTAA